MLITNFIAYKYLTAQTSLLNFQQEFEQQMAQMKAEFDAMKMSKDKLEEEMGSLRDTYDQKVDAVYDGKNPSLVNTKKGKSGTSKTERTAKVKQQKNGHQKAGKFKIYSTTILLNY